MNLTDYILELVLCDSKVDGERREECTVLYQGALYPLCCYHYETERCPSCSLFRYHKGRKDCSAQLKAKTKEVGRLSFSCWRRQT